MSDELLHYGVKGMRWGVRKRDTSPQKVRVIRKPGKALKTKGGENQKASPDAIRAAVAKQKARRSTTDSLSNKELQELVTRMNLEQQYARLDPKPVNIGLRFIQSQLPGALNEQAVSQFGDSSDVRVQKALRVSGAIAGFSSSIQGGGKKKKK